MYDTYPSHGDNIVSSSHTQSSPVWNPARQLPAFLNAQVRVAFFLNGDLYIFLNSFLYNTLPHYSTKVLECQYEVKSIDLFNVVIYWNNDDSIAYSFSTGSNTNDDLAYTIDEDVPS